MWSTRCLHARLQGADPHHHHDGSRCPATATTPACYPAQFDCAAALRGVRFVALQSPVSRLEIAEVRVLDEQGANIALTATASTGAARAPDATSGCSNGAASYAIDGNTCTYASSLYGDLLVDIGSQRVVTNVVVIGRNAGYWGDNFSFRNNGASVSFLDASRAVLGSALLNSPCTYNPYIDSPGLYAGATCTTTTFSLLSMPLDTSPSSTVMSSPSGTSSPAVFVSASASVAA